MTDGAPRLLSGGNPQIPKGDGDGPVQAYLAAMPGWKRALGERLDDLIECAPRRAPVGAAAGETLAALLEGVADGTDLRFRFSTTAERSSPGNRAPISAPC